MQLDLHLEIKEAVSYVLIVVLQKNDDASLLLSKNKIKAVRRVIFKIIKNTFGVCNLPAPLTGSQVDLSSVVTWIIREQRLHKADKDLMEMNIKLDGRPFWGVYIMLFW